HAPILFMLTHAVGVVFPVIVNEYFVFFTKKMTMEVCDQHVDSPSHATQLITDASYIALSAIILIFALNYFYPKIKEQKGKWPKKLLFNFFFLAFCFVGIRGGLQLRSLSPKDAFMFSDFNLGNVALNPIYTLVRSMGKKGVERV